MVFQPFIIGVYGVLDLLHCFFKIIPARTTDDEVAPVDFLPLFFMWELLRNAIDPPVVDICNKYREDPFVVFECMCNFLVAHLRCDRIRTDQEEKCIRLFDAAVDLLLPILAFGDVLPVSRYPASRPPVRQRSSGQCPGLYGSRR